MGIEQLARLLAEAAEDVPSPELAEVAWARASQVRRRRRVVGSGVAAAALLGAGWFVATVPFAGPDLDGARPTATTTLPSKPVTQIDRMPAKPAVLNDSPLPPSLDDFIGPKAVPLSTRPVSRAVALYEQPDAAKSPSPVYVLGDDGAVRRLDGVALDFVTGADKEVSPLPLTPTALSPDGRRAAFPQRDVVVVVDLTTAKEQRFPVPGYNLEIRWQGPATVLVGQADATYSVDVASGRVTRVAGEWSLPDGTTDPAGPATIDQRGLEPYAIDQWRGPAWRFGDQVARVGNAPGLGPVAAVIDVRTGALTNVLVLPSGRSDTCCIALGWFDAQTVLVQLGLDGVVAWDIRTGQVSSVTEEFKGVLAIAPR